jgi:hypothetical protein
MGFTTEKVQLSASMLAARNPVFAGFGGSFGAGMGSCGGSARCFGLDDALDGFDLDVRWRSWEAGLLWAETDAIASLGLRLPCA